MKKIGMVVLSWCLVAGVFAADEYAVKPGRFVRQVAPVLSPAEALGSFRLPDGFVIETVAAEPLVEDPVAMCFDADGRLFVAEMLGFTLDVNGTDEFAPTGRIRRLTDRDGDGVMDDARVFAEGLVLPRSVCAYRGGLLVAEHDKLWFMVDADGDGRADRKELVDAEYATAGSVEHRPNGLLLALDNWIYNGASTKRYRWHAGRWEIGKTEKRGQWGITQDNHGRLFYNFNWSQLHADLLPPNYSRRNPDFETTFAINVGLTADQRVFPIHPTPAVNRGYTPGVLDERGHLTGFASACSPHYYRGGAFGDDFADEVFVCGPCANIVKRNTLTRNGVTLSAANAYEGREFLASTDERFRPVALAGGPDGALYVVDMYRGVIQQWEFMTKYLRDESTLRGLFAPVHRGRIYRVRSLHRGGREPGPLARKTGAELADLLADPNGWVRDTAQRLLIERADPALTGRLVAMALNAKQALTRIHALWTLAGTGCDDPQRLLPALKDRHSRVRTAALRVLEEELASHHPDTRTALREHLTKTAPNETEDVQLQALLTLGELKPRALSTLAAIIDGNVEIPVMREALLSSLGGDEDEFLALVMQPDFWADASIGRALLLESLAGTIANSGDGRRLGGVLRWLDCAPREFGWRRRALLAGVSVALAGRRGRPVVLAKSPAFADRLEQFDEPGLKRELTGLANTLEWPGHKPSRRVDAGRPLTADEQDDFTKGRQVLANYCSACHGTDGRGVKPLAPPLVDSEWVNGPPSRLIRIVLHGAEGPIPVAGRIWRQPDILPSMPSMAVLRSDDIGAVLTYIRRAWGHAADPVDPKTVTKLRQLNFGRLTPWTAAELAGIPADEKLPQGDRPYDRKK